MIDDLFGLCLFGGICGGFLAIFVAIVSKRAAFWMGVASVAAYAAAFIFAFLANRATNRAGEVIDGRGILLAGTTMLSPMTLPALFAIWVFRGAKPREKSDQATCWRCGYNLTLNESGVCPECGVCLAAEGTGEQGSST